MHLTRTLDRTMISLDNSTNKAQLGANAILAVSRSEKAGAEFRTSSISLSVDP